MSDRRRRIAVFVVTFAASAAATAWVQFARASGPPMRGVSPAAQQRWQQLSADRRQQCVEWHRRLHRRADYGQVLREARAFAALSDRARDRLRYLNGVLEEIAGTQPVNRRRFLLSLPQRARAIELYRILEQEAPARLAEVRAELARRF